MRHPSVFLLGPVITFLECHTLSAGRPNSTEKRGCCLRLGKMVRGKNYKHGCDRARSRRLCAATGRRRRWRRRCPWGSPRPPRDTYIYIYIYIHTHTCIYIYIYIYTHMCEYMHIYIYIGMCICVCVYIYIYIYVHNLSS